MGSEKFNPWLELARLEAQQRQLEGVGGERGTLTEQDIMRQKHEMAIKARMMGERGALTNRDMISQSISGEPGPLTPGDLQRLGVFGK